MEVITKLVANPRFASMMQEKINMKVDTTVIDQEITALEKQLKQSYAVKRKTLEEIEALDPDARHYKRLKTDLDDRLYRMYDKIDDQEQSLIEARAKKQSIESEKVTGDNIYKILIYFDKFYSLMNEEEQRKLMESLIEEIQIYEERQPSGQWLKSITFRLPIIEKDMKISVGDSLDSKQHVETVCLLTVFDDSFQLLGNGRLQGVCIHLWSFHIQNHGEFHFYGIRINHITESDINPDWNSGPVKICDR